MFSAARTGAVALAAALLAGTASAPALADTASPGASPSSVTVPSVLYGKTDPTYDGVWRQSLSLLALHTAKITPAPAAVSWLTGQQCADGGWPSYRANTGKPCTAATEDTNATSAAVQALTALGGHGPAVAKGVAWLRRQQNTDGGWSFNPGGPSDANSTGVVISALVAAKTDPSTVTRKGHTAYDGLAAFQIGCSAPAKDRGAFAYQPDKAGKLAPNGLASAQASLAAAGAALPVSSSARKVGTLAPLGCTGAAKDGPVPHATSADAVSHWLVAQLRAHKQHLMQSMPGSAPTPDYTATSYAVLGLVAAGHPQEAADAADWLADNGYPWTQGKSGVNPASAATLLLVAHATGLDPYNFGGMNLVQLLINAGPKPAAVPVVAASASATGTQPPGASVTGAGDDDQNGGFSPVWLIAMGLVIGIGGGLFIRLNRKNAREQGSAGTTDTPSAGGSSDDSSDDSAGTGGDRR